MLNIIFKPFTVNSAFLILSAANVLLSGFMTVYLTVTDAVGLGIALAAICTVGSVFLVIALYHLQKSDHLAHVRFLANFASYRANNRR